MVFLYTIVTTGRIKDMYRQILVNICKGHVILYICYTIEYHKRMSTSIERINKKYFMYHKYRTYILLLPWESNYLLHKR